MTRNEAGMNSTLNIAKWYPIMKPSKIQHPDATLSILDTKPCDGDVTYPCELAVYWFPCGVEAVVCGYVEADSDGNFDLNSFAYGQWLSDSRLSDNDDWHADWGMAITIPDGVDYTADEVGEAMTKIMHRLKTARIERD